MTLVSSTTLSGYVSTSASWKPGTGAGIGPAVLNSYGAGKSDGFNLDVVNLAVSKPLDEAQWSAGYTAELLLGPDAGVFTGGAAGGNSLAIKQAYVALNAPIGNGVALKMGVWDTIIGYEGYNYTANPNYSRSIGYGLEPTTYTGLQAAYKVSDALSLTGGVANSTGAAGNNILGKSGTESSKAYMAAVSFTLPDSLGFLGKSTVTAGVVNHADPGATAKLVNYYAGITLNTPVAALKVGGSFDYQTSDKGPYAEAFGLYASYALSEKLKLNTRAEYAAGSSTAGAVFANAAKAAGGNNSKFMEVTATLDYALWANVTTRAEVRWDSDVSGAPGNVFGTPADEKNAVTVSLNVIYKF